MVKDNVRRNLTGAKKLVTTLLEMEMTQVRHQATAPTRSEAEIRLSQAVCVRPNRPRVFACH